MSELRYEDWMTESDAVIWHIERDPLLRSTVTSLMFLERTPTQQRFDALVANMVERVPRLRQRVVETPGQLTTPRWEADPHFDSAHHVQRIRLPKGGATSRAMLDHVQYFAGRGFDKDRPLWELLLIEGTRKVPTALAIKLHHVIADGLGLVQMLGEIVDFEPDPPAAQTPPAPTASPAPDRTSAGVLAHRISTDMQNGLKVGRAALGLARGLLTRPVSTAGDVTDMTESLAKVLKPATTRLSGLLAGSSMSPRFDTVVVPLADLKAAAALVNGTINTGFVASTLAGLARYHKEMGDDSAEIRMHMPVNIRSGDDADQAGNQFAPVRFALPLGEKEPLDRLTETRDLLAEVTHEPALPHVAEISGTISKLGPNAVVSIIGSMMRGIDVTTSNVPGPSFPIWMAGSKVEEFYAFGPLAGSAINITLFSYDGMLHVGVNVDQAAVTDPDRFTVCLRSGFAEIIGVAQAQDA